MERMRSGFALEYSRRKATKSMALCDAVNVSRSDIVITMREWMRIASGTSPQKCSEFLIQKATQARCPQLFVVNG